MSYRKLHAKLLKRRGCEFQSRTVIRGFTIVELLVIIVIIGILVAISLVSYSGINSRAIGASIQSDLESDAKILKLYQVEYEQYPESLDASNCPITPIPDSKYCLKASSNTSLTYLSSGQTFTLKATKNSTSYRVTESTSIAYVEPIVCPTGFIVVPGSLTYGTSDFCVMKYEAKNVGGVATSQAALAPWVNISQLNAITTATSACDGCELITEAQWMTIVQNVLGVSSNWSGGVVGSGYIYSGHNDNSPSSALAASTDDSNGYYLTNSDGTNQRRTLNLSNGEVIWDFAGNVWDWTSGLTTGGQPGASSYAWRDYSAITNRGNLSVNIFPDGTGVAGAGSWTASANGVGKAYSDSSGSTSHPFMRGGCWDNGVNTGIFSVHLYDPVTYSSIRRGFRVTVTY